MQINDPAGETATMRIAQFRLGARPLAAMRASSEGECLLIDGRSDKGHRNKAIADTDWSGCDLVIEPAAR